MNSKRAHDKKHFYKYMKASTCLKVLEGGKLRWTCPLEFNDPFDMQAPIFPEFTAKELRQKFNEKWLDIIFSDEPPNFYRNSIFTKLTNQTRLLCKELERSDFKEMMSELEAEPIPSFETTWRNSRKVLRQSMEQSRVLCLAENKDNILMWSHYADSHTGAVLQLKCNVETDSAWLMAQQVNYKNNFPNITADELVELIMELRPEKIEQLALRRFVTTKSIDWKYEKEWRVVSHLVKDGHKYKDWDVLPSEIESVYLGCNIKEENKSSILKCIHNKYPETQVYQCTKNETEYKLDTHLLEPKVL